MRLDMTQQQRMELRLLPQIIQFMELLQLPVLALEERLDQELSTNPMLELRQESPDSEPAHDEADTTPPEGVDDALLVRDENNNAEDFNRLEALKDVLRNDIDFEDPHILRERLSSARLSGERDPKMDAMANTAARPVCLNEYLHQQWNMIEAPEGILVAGKAIIDCIDDDGWLREPLEAIASRVSDPAASGHESSALSMKDLADGLVLVQQLDPPGIGARNMKECMLIQLDQMEGDYELQKRIVLDHLEEIERNRLPQVARKLKITLPQLKKSLDTLARLNRHPGMLIGRHESAIIVPDVIVEYSEDLSDYEVRLASRRTGRLRLSHLYKKMLDAGKIDKKTQKYLREHQQSARALIDALLKRRDSLISVSEELVKSQREFLDKGPEYLRPLPMARVASRLGIHESTVSRAVAGKYIQTPRGIFPLRKFFTGGIKGTNGEQVARGSIHVKLQQIIDAEDKTHPLRDEELVAKLREQGVKIARRTVAKYRSLMNVPPVHKRRQYE